MRKKRIAIVLGCNRYQTLNNLRSAEIDAQRVFDVLTSESQGQYDSRDSVLLKSPTYTEVILALTAHRSSLNEADVVVVFFAGHGVASTGSYFLCLRDSVPDSLSTTALSLMQLFTIVNEIRAPQCNIIIDACEAGGLVADISALIKPELIGGRDTPGISIVASSLADQYSVETDGGGVATSFLLRCLTGEHVVQTQRPYLDLVEVGRSMATLMASNRISQTPVAWGVNLYGEPRFCINPHFDGQRLASFFQVTSIPTHSESGKGIGKHAEQIWRMYYGMPDEFVKRAVYGVLKSTLGECRSDSESAASFVAGITRTLTQRNADSSDLFRKVEILAVSIACLLQRTGDEGAVDLRVAALGAELVDEVSRVCGVLVEELSHNEFALLSAGLADLFYLPIRVCRLLGWVGSASFVGRWLDLPLAPDRAVLKRLIELLSQTYQPSFVCMSDEQAPYVLVFLLAAEKEGWLESRDLIFGALVNDFIAKQGKVADAALGADKVLEYLLRLESRNLDPLNALVAQPTELLSVLLMSASLFGVEDVIDPYLRKIDHQSFNLFIPTCHRDFAEAVIENGRNHTFQIGHGVWRVEEFYARWTHACLPELTADVEIERTTTKIGAICAAMIFPNRTPWFLVAHY